MNASDYAAVLAGVPRRRDQVLPALRAVHEAAGWLPEGAIEAAGRHTFVPLSEIYGIISSYSELRLSPPNRPHVELCMGLACRLAGAEMLAEGITLPIEHIACRFLCGVAPVAEIDGSYHGRLTRAGFDALLREVKAGLPS